MAALASSRVRTRGSTRRLLTRASRWQTRARSGRGAGDPCAANVGGSCVGNVQKSWSIPCASKGATAMPFSLKLGLPGTGPYPENAQEIALVCPGPQVPPTPRAPAVPAAGAQNAVPARASATVSGAPGIAAEFSLSEALCSGVGDPIPGLGGQPLASVRASAPAVSAAHEPVLTFQARSLHQPCLNQRHFCTARFFASSPYRCHASLAEDRPARRVMRVMAPTRTWARRCTRSWKECFRASTGEPSATRWRAFALAR